MAKPDKVFINEKFHQFILDAVSSAPEEAYRYLNNGDMNILHNLEGSTLDEKLHILGVLNYRFALVVGHRHKAARPFGRQTLKALAEFARSKILKLLGRELKDYGVFVMADKEIMESLAAASCQSRGESYYLIRDYEEIALNIERVSGVFRQKSIELQAINSINALLSETFALPFILRRKYERSRYKIGPTLLPILFFMAARPDEVLTIRQVALHFGYDCAKTEVKMKLHALERAGMVTAMGEDRFQLTGFGVHTATQLRERILAKSGQ